MAGGVTRPAGKVYIDPGTGRVTLEFDAFLSALINAVNAVSQGGLVAPKSHTVATVPTASEHTGRLIYVSDGAAGSPVLAFSDGTDWLRVDTLAAISSS